ncbi:MAG TPA: hypothetical protein VFU50_12760 [Terriglobales bacterium]|nr:hypothetical protein [Terriglobales bacterium]
MLNKEPGPERAELGFREAVLSSFKFLSDAGFHPVEKQTTFVRYESSEVFVNVFHGRASFELGLEIGRLREPKRTLSLYDIVAWAGGEKTEDLGQHVAFQVSSREDVQKFVPKLAALAKKYSAPFLRGDHAAFDSAFAIQSERWEKYVTKVNLSGVRKSAEAAWQAKDYAQVVALYDTMRKNLTEVEAKKLSYAEKQSTAGVGSRASRTRKQK